MYCSLCILCFLLCYFCSRGESDTTQQDGRTTPKMPEPLRRYQQDLCQLPEVSLTCPPEYVLTEVTVEYLNGGNCYCFVQDLTEMAEFLHAQCFGNASCRNQFSVKPRSCGHKRRILYHCEPAQSFCDSLHDQRDVYYYSSLVHLVSPGFPHSYPATPQQAMRCVTHLSVLPTQERHQRDPSARPRVSLTQSEVAIHEIQTPTGTMKEYVSLCEGNILHIGALYSEMGPEPSLSCSDYSNTVTFELETPVTIVYYYRYQPYLQQRRGALIQLRAPGRSTIEIRRALTPTAGAGVHPTNAMSTLQTFSPPEIQTLGAENATVAAVDTISRTSPESSGGGFYSGTILTAIIIVSVVLVLLAFILAVCCLWRRRHASWKSAFVHAARLMGCKAPSQRRHRVALPDGPARLSSRPSSGSTINPYAYSSAAPASSHVTQNDHVTSNHVAQNQNLYSEPQAVYENHMGKTGTGSYRDSGVIYDDVIGQSSSSGAAHYREPHYDNHISALEALRNGNVQKTPVQNGKKSNKNVLPSTSANIEDLYSKPNAVRKRLEEDANHSHSTASVTLQEGETLLVENELYHSKNIVNS